MRQFCAHIQVVNSSTVTSTTGSYGHRIYNCRLINILESYPE